MQKAEKVFITGAGVVSPLGDTLDEYWQSMLSNNEFLPNPELDEYKDKIRNRLLYKCHNHDFLSFRDSLLGCTSRYTLAAGKMALEDAQLDDYACKNIGISVGTTMGDQDLLEEFWVNKLTVKAMEPFPFRVASALSSELGIFGPNLTTSAACTSGLYAIDLGVQAIQQGLADIVIAGGSESLSRVVVACFNRMGALDPVKCRPFDAGRQGTVLGEGSAMLVLESESSMLQRGYNSPYGEIKGSGWSCDAHQPTAPEPEGHEIERAVFSGMRQAGLSPADIDCVIPHGTGTILNDKLELQMLQKVFKSRINTLFLYAIKSKLGHNGGASGAFSCLTACLMLKYGVVPPNANLAEPDPLCEFDLSGGQPVSFPLRNIMLNAYAFGGNNISLILGI